MSSIGTPPDIRLLQVDIAFLETVFLILGSAQHDKALKTFRGLARNSFDSVKSFDEDKEFLLFIIIYYFNNFKFFEQLFTLSHIINL